jgi:ABC-type lipopolysaccharide export system ATPase subunit
MIRAVISIKNPVEEYTVLDNSLNQDNEVVGVLGPNGADRTTI